MSGSVRSWQVTVEEAGERLDRHLTARLEVPRNQIQQWIRDRRVRLNGMPAKPSTPVAEGDRVEAEPPPRRDVRLTPEEGELRVLFEDPWLIVLDKPPGLSVHPGAGRPTGTLAHLLLGRYPEIAGVGGPGRPGIVHRLDKDTSGVLVVARTPQTYQHLVRAFAGRRVDKQYLAVVYGRPPARGTIDAPIGRHREKRREMTVRPDGRPARTHFRTLAARAGIAVLQLDLATGRTHQIRVHLKSLRHPLVGDPVYGEARWRALPRRVQGPLRDFPRPALHAWRLAFDHPDDRRPLTFEAPVPDDLVELWETVTGERFPESGEGGAPTAAPPAPGGACPGTPPPACR